MYFSKYNDNGKNLFNVFAKDDDEVVATTSASWSKSRVSVKSNKDEQCSIESGDQSLFNSRGYTLDSRMQMVEIAQFKEAQVRYDIKHDLEYLTNCNKLLLDEREQEIDLAKIICPEYDRTNEYWASFIQLSSDISELKNEIVVLQKKLRQICLKLVIAWLPNS